MRDPVAAGYGKDRRGAESGRRGGGGDGAGVEKGRARHLAEPVAKSTGTGSTLKS